MLGLVLVPLTGACFGARKGGCFEGYNKATNWHRSENNQKTLTLKDIEGYNKNKGANWHRSENIWKTHLTDDGLEVKIWPGGKQEEWKRKWPRNVGEFCWSRHHSIMESIRRGQKCSCFQRAARVKETQIVFHIIIYPPTHKHKEIHKCLKLGPSIKVSKVLKLWSNT